MEELIELSDSLIFKTSFQFKRYLFDKVNWQNRLIGIKGARGTGKTTLLLQWLKSLEMPSREKLYLSLDELYFTSNSLIDTAKAFYQAGGKVLVLDEVHKYPTWSQEIKNLYDRYEDLKIIFTGSSIIDIARQEGDLSRRALLYELKGMSYREYLNLRHGYEFEAISLEALMSSEVDLRVLFPADFRPLAQFNAYLQYGYYPFSEADIPGYYTRLRQLVRTIVEYDMAELKGFDIRQAKKMLQLITVIAQQVPFKPNINNLATKTGIHRNSINNYLYFLSEARLLSLLSKGGIRLNTLQKPEKIFLDNTNLLFALSDVEPAVGTVREVFFNNQLQAVHKVNYIEQTDFEIDGQFAFEIGGPTKGSEQLSGLQHARVVKDGLEYPVGRALPLWAFGFLY